MSVTEKASGEVTGSGWRARLGLLALSIAMLWLSFAPVHQFYLAWAGLVPFFLAVREVKSAWRAFALGWIWGFCVFATNMWWLVYVTVPGLFALAFYLALFWGFAAIAIRSLLAGERTIFNPRSSILIVFLIATTWVGIEWLRGNLSFLGRQGLPWQYLGQTQTPLLPMCQIADVLGIFGVTWWVVLINATIALTIIHRAQFCRVIPAIVAAAVILVGFGVYGAFRMSQKTTAPGPTVLVVQSNYKQSNTGEKGAPLEEIFEFHFTMTRDALAAARQRGQKVDLVVWSETMMPPINPEARDVARGTTSGAFWDSVVDRIGSLAREYDTSFLVGGIRWSDWRWRGEHPAPYDRRNTAYFFPSSTATLSETRYDKIRLVPFGEYIPFKDSIPPLYQLFIKFGPNYYEEYILTPGRELTLFELPGGTRFVVAICFEDLVSDLVAAMVRGANGTRRADFIVNITNDGWFRAGQMPQHLQAAVFRSIENRVPTARSVNTGISGFVDSVGRTSNLVAAGTEGASIGTLMLDRRVSLYTRVGDAFGLACAGAALGVFAWMIAQRLRNRSQARQ